MTVGIYRLVFEGTNKCYIGQSINIERRYKSHLVSMQKSSSNQQKLHAAYKVYGFPKLEILCECSEKDLNRLEDEAIEIFNSTIDGFNTNVFSNDAPCYHGEEHPRSIYSNETIIKVATLLSDPNIKGSEISSITGVSLNIIQDISSLKTHSWLSEAIPDIYKKLVDLKGTRKNPKTAEQRGISYPAVLSPDGIVHNSISNLKQFCEQHNIHRTNFRKMLNGKNKTCQGWRLVPNG